MSPRHSGPAGTARTLCAASLLALALPGSSFAAPQIGEQIDRADGIAGTSALADTYGAEPQLSEDGRYAAFGYFKQSGSKTGEIAPTLVPVLGVYVRDLVTNRTVQVVSTPTPYTTRYRLTADGTKLSFVSDAKLLPADTDNTADVYIADTTTKALTLATPSTSTHVGGQITRDGSAVLTYSGNTISRTPLAGGPATTLATNFEGLLAASADGSTIAYQPAGEGTRFAFARAGRAPVTVARGENADIAYSVVLSPDGKTAALLPYDRRNVRAVNVETGAVAYASWRLPAYNAATSAFNLSNDGWLQYSVSGTSGGAIAEANLATRAVRIAATDIPYTPAAVTANGKFAAAGYGHLFVAPTGATPLPGTVDPPSPFAYLRFDYGCVYPNVFFPGIKPYIAVGSIAGMPIPAPVSATVVVRNRANNQITNQFTITSTTAQYPISLQSGNFRVDASVKLADGRTVTGTYYQDSYARAQCFPGGI